ncbi:MAG TPA: lysophospholipid acyltransferase family protein [Actinomycetota bacterium]|nr:lysophospholipid acyltransferase family protein [Actinomycetota bacterium]
MATAVALPPVKLWFNWRFEDLDRIPRDGPAIVACNHASYLDPFANAYAVIEAGRRPRFIAKAELFEIPVVGMALRGARQIPVVRGRRDGSALVAAERALAGGEVVVIYPEGTVTNRPDHLPMQGKTGAVRLALATGAPIVPMASWGSHPVWQKSGRGSLRFGRPVWVKVGTALDLSARASEREDRDAVQAMTDGLMRELTDLVVDLRDRYPRGWGDDR